MIIPDELRKYLVLIDGSAAKETWLPKKTALKFSFDEIGK
jgi:hypothetical protein